MAENIMIALKIMCQGMLGIFAAILVIMLVISVIKKFSSENGKKDKTRER